MKQHMITSNSPIDFSSIATASGGTDSYTNTPEFKDWLVNLLADAKPTTVTFTKKDGTARVMRCTRNPELIPTEQHPSTESTRKASTTSVTAFDLDKNEWRSFLPENITHINYEF
jgi:hypothetical protein